MRPAAILRNAMALLIAAALPAQLRAQDTGVLTLNVVSGDRAINNISRFMPTPTIVEVRDETGQPVRGAAVTFNFPPNGPSGAFADGSHSFTANTSADGRATLPGFAPNRLQGSYEIVVNATAAPRSGTTLIRETNAYSDAASSKRGVGSGGKMLIVLGVGAAIAAGSLLAIKGGSVGDHSAVPPTTVSLGTISIGAPH